MASVAGDATLPAALLASDAIGSPPINSVLTEGTGAFIVFSGAGAGSVAKTADSSCFSQGCSTLLAQLVTPLTRT